MRQTSDGGYIVAGSTTSPNDGDVTGNHGGYDSWIVKLTNAGAIDWEKSLGGTGADHAYSVRQTTDGGYIVAGYSNSHDGDVTGNHGGDDYWVVKLTAAGDIDWQKSLGGSWNDNGMDARQTADGGYIVTGWSNSFNGDVTGNHGGNDYWVVKLDSTGNIVWQKSLGGSGNDNSWGEIQQTADGGYIVAGQSNSNGGDVSGNHGGYDYWVVKLTDAGAIDWQKSLGGSGFDEGYSVRQTSDGGYIVAGFSESNDQDVSGNHGGRDAWVVKLGPSGNILWQHPLGGSGQDQAQCMRQTADGGYIVAGSSDSHDGDVTGNHGGTDYWIVKLHGGIPKSIVDQVTTDQGTGDNPLYASLEKVDASTVASQWGLPGERDITLANVKGWFLFTNNKPLQNLEGLEGDFTYMLVDDSTDPPTIYTYAAKTPPTNIKYTKVGGNSPNAGGGSGGAGASSCDVEGTTCSYSSEECQNCYALLISGGYNKENNYIRYWNDVSCMYKTLRSKYCYPEDHIFVLLSDGTDPAADRNTGLADTPYDNSPTDLDGAGRPVDVYGPATKQSVTDTLGYLIGTPIQPGKLGKEDHLFIFTTNHGGKEEGTNRVRLWLWNGEYIWDNEFADLLTGYPDQQVKSITMTMEQCYGGGFVDDFTDPARVPAGQTRVIATAANDIEPSWGNDFSYWWIRGSGGEAGTTISGLPSLKNAFDYGSGHDPSATSNPPLEHPMYGDVQQGSGLTSGLSSCVKFICPAPGLLWDTRMPTDPDTNGIYENLDTDPLFTMNDVILYFNHMDWIMNPATEPACAFDANHNGRIDFADIVTLYGRAPP